MELVTKLIFYISSFFLSITPANTYVEGVVGQPRSFLPSQTITQTDKTVSGLIYRGLFRYNIYGTLTPDLADTWEVSDDGLIYTIKIKPDQYWINGQKITADDLIYTAFTISDLNDVATDRVDDLTVRYTLPNKFSPFLSLLTAGIMQDRSEEEQDPLRPITNGDFRVLRVEKAGPIIKKVTLLNNDTDHNIKKLVFRYYVNEEELITGAKLGEIDGFIASGKPELENFDEYRFPVQGVYYALYFNLRDDKFDDVELRQKMEKVLPVDNLIFDRGIRVKGPISRSVFTDVDLEYDLYDATIKESLTDKKISLTVPDTQVQLELAREIRKAWKDKLGISTDIIRVNPDDFTEKVIKERDFEVLLYGQEVGRDPDRYVNWHTTQSNFPGLNLSGFSHIRGDRALEEGRNEVDNNQRLVHYKEFQKAFMESTPAILLYHPFTKYYVSKNIEGMGEKYTFTVHDRFLDFPNWKKTKAF
jgi:peptide/nickel transport system substrate-binding protein